MLRVTKAVWEIYDTILLSRARGQLAEAVFTRSPGDEWQLGHISFLERMREIGKVGLGDSTDAGRPASSANMDSGK